MSATFFAQSPIVGWACSCSCGDEWSSDVFPSYLEAHHAAFEACTVNPICGDPMCLAMPLAVVARTAHPEAPSLNVSNANARVLLAQLGLATTDLCGTLTGEDFLGRVLLATALATTDAGRPQETTGGFTDCGRRAGYLDERIAVLRDIADFAVSNALPVVWS